jgi:hypothetical protein
LNDSYIESKYIGAENLFNETDPNYLNALTLIQNFNEGSEKYDENFRFYVFHGRYFHDIGGVSIEEKEYNVLKKTYLSEEETDKLGYIPLSSIQEYVIDNLRKNPKFSSKRIVVLFITEVYTTDPKNPNNYFKLKYFSFSPLALEKFEEDILTGKTPQGKWSFDPISVGASKEVYAQAFYEIVNKGITMLKEGRKAHQETIQAANELIRKTLDNKSGNSDKGSSWWYKFVESVKESEAKLRGNSYNQSFGVAFYGATSTEPNSIIQNVTADNVLRLDAEGLEVFYTWLSKRGYTKAIQYDKNKRTIVINKKELKKQYGRDVREIVSDFAKYLADEAHPKEVEDFINKAPTTWAISETDLKLKKIGKTWQELDACNIAILGNCGDTRALTLPEIVNEPTSFTKGIVTGDVNLWTDYTKVDADINKICIVIYFGSSTNTSVNLSAKRYTVTDPLLQVQLDKIIENKNKNSSCKLEREANITINCPEFNPLRPKALAAGMSASNIDAALAKLCTIPNADTRQAINTELTSYTNAEVRAFFEDLLVGDSDKHLGYNASKIDAGIVQAWKVVKDARRDDANYRIDFELLKMTAIFRNHPQEGNKLLNFVGGDVGLKEILKENEKMPCHTCNNNTKRAYLSKADSMMIHLGYFVRNHQSTAGANRVIKQLKREKAESWHTDIPGIWTVEGAAFVLRTVYDGKYTTDITEFEKPTPTDADGKFAIADIYKNGVYIDCKSWAITQEGYTDSFDELIAGRGSYPQFLKYLKAIISLDKLEYWFDAKKTPKLDDVKKKWQQLFQSNKQPEIFETIWQNARLRGDIWDDIPPVINQTVIDSYRAKFVIMVSSTSNSFYDFIKVK